MQMTYITGNGRGNSDYDLPDETHLYSCVENGLAPMCKRGFNRHFGTAFSIFRGCVGELYVCPVCEGRAGKNKPPLSWKLPRKLKKKINKRVANWSQYTPLLPGLPLSPPDVLALAREEET